MTALRPTARHWPLCLLALLCLCGTVTHAEQADRTQRINVEGDHGQDDNKTGTYTLDGRVQVTQGTLQLNCDHAVMVQSPSGEQVITAVGHPATFRQRMDNGVDWINGHSDQIVYDSKTGILKLVGSAWLQRAKDEMTGNVVTYNSISEVYTADAGAVAPTGAGATQPASRVHFVIEPKQPAAAPASPSTKKNP